MSAQGSHKMRKSSTLTNSKQSPLKAILPVSLKKESHLKKSKSNSPTSSLKFPFYSDNLLPGHRSPGSISSKGLKCKNPSCKPDSFGGYIRRTTSLDAINLQSQCPKETFTIQSVMLKVDKATQTTDLNNERKNRHSDFKNDDIKYEKYIRHRLQKVNKDNQNCQKFGLRLVSPSLQGEYTRGGSQTPPGSVLPNLIRSGPQSPIQGFPVNSTAKSSLGRTLMRNSVEGLNQEIERLVLKDVDDRFFNCNSIPEGHRAPLADILRQTRSVNTQTPGVDEIECDFGANNPPSRDSGSPMVSRNIDFCTPPKFFNGSRGSSPDDFNKFRTSPHINTIFAREPPDGCERVNLKLEESSTLRGKLENIGFIPLKPISTAFQFKPSLGSAFHPLHGDHLSIHCQSGLGSGSSAMGFHEENDGGFTEDLKRESASSAVTSHLNN